MPVCIWRCSQGTLCSECLVAGCLHPSPLYSPTYRHFNGFCGWCVVFCLGIRMRKWLLIFIFDFQVKPLYKYWIYSILVLWLHFQWLKKQERGWPRCDWLPDFCYPFHDMWLDSFTWTHSSYYWVFKFCTSARLLSSSLFWLITLLVLKIKLVPCILGPLDFCFFNTMPGNSFPVTNNLVR